MKSVISSSADTCLLVDLQKVSAMRVAINCLLSPPLPLKGEFGFESDHDKMQERVWVWRDVFILSTYVLGIETERGRFIDEDSCIPKVRLLSHCTYVHSQ